MAFPSSADIDITKLDNDNDSIRDSRAELYKMAGYVNDIITEGPAGLLNDSLMVGEADADTVQIFANNTVSSKTLELYARTGGSDSPSLSLLSDGTVTIATAGDQVIKFDGPVRVKSRTTSERDLIPNKLAGMIIFNTTTNKFQGYTGSGWVDFH